MHFYDARGRTVPCLGRRTHAARPRAPRGHVISSDLGVTAPARPRSVSAKKTLSFSCASSPMEDPGGLAAGLGASACTAFGSISYAAWLMAWSAFFASLLAVPAFFLLIFVTWRRYLGGDRSVFREPVKWAARQFFNYMMERYDVEIDWDMVRISMREPCAVWIHGLVVPNPPPQLISAWADPNLLTVGLLHIDFGSWRQLLCLCLGAFELPGGFAIGWLETRVDKIELHDVVLHIEDLIPPRKTNGSWHLPNNLELMTGFESLESAGKYIEQAEERKEAREAEEAARLRLARAEELRKLVAARAIQRQWRLRRTHHLTAVQRSVSVEADKAEVRAAVMLQKMLRGHSVRNRGVGGLMNSPMKRDSKRERFVGLIASPIKATAVVTAKATRVGSDVGAAVGTTVAVTAKATAKAAKSTASRATADAASIGAGATAALTRNLSDVGHFAAHRLTKPFGKNQRESQAALRRRALVPLMAIGKLDLQTVRVTMSETKVEMEEKPTSGGPSTADPAVPRSFLTKAKSRLDKTGLNAIKGGLDAVADYNLGDFTRHRMHKAISRAVNSRALLKTFCMQELYGPVDKVRWAIVSTILNNVLMRMTTRVMMGGLGIPCSQPKNVKELRAAMIVQAAQRGKQAQHALAETKHALAETKNAAIAMQAAARGRASRAKAAVTAGSHPSTRKPTTPRKTGAPSKAGQAMRSLSSGFMRMGSRGAKPSSGKRTDQSASFL